MEVLTIWDESPKILEREFDFSLVENGTNEIIWLRILYILLGFLVENIFIPELNPNILDFWNNSVAQNPSASTLLISP